MGTTIHAWGEAADLIEDLGALGLVDALDGEVLDGLLIPSLVHRLRSPSHQITQHATKRKQQNDQKWFVLEPDPSCSSRIRGGREGEAEPPPSGAEAAREGGAYRVLAAADGLVDVEVVHIGGAGRGGGGGAPPCRRRRGLGFANRGGGRDRGGGREDGSEYVS